MQLKPGVKLVGLVPEMVLAAVIVRDCYAARDPLCSCTITSGNDSRHSDTSLHYQGRAFDFRTHDYHGDVEKLVADIKLALSPDFDVVLEGKDTVNEHIHVEYDPKN